MSARRGQVVLAVVLWVLGLVAVMTAVDVLVHHEAWNPGKLLLRLVVFGVAGAVLGVLWVRLQGRQR